MPLRVALLCYTADGPYVTEMRCLLGELDVTVEICLFGQPLPAYDVISLLDLQDPTLHDMSEETFKIITRYLTLHKEKLIWVTPASQINCEDPRAAMVLGLARAVRTEYLRDLFTVEVDGSSTTVSAAIKAITEILRRSHALHANPEPTGYDYEYIIVEGEILVPRFHWQTTARALARDAERSSNGSTSKQLTMTAPGLLHTMMWTEAEIKKPTKGEILVETKAVGLNFRVSSPHSGVYGGTDILTG